MPSTSANHTGTSVLQPLHVTRKTARAVTFPCWLLPAPAECAPVLLAGAAPAPPEASLTGPSLHTASSAHGSVVAPHSIRQHRGRESDLAVLL